MAAVQQPGTHLGWNIWSDVHQLFVYHFMVNALWAATISAVLAGVIGWFMVLRRQTFAGHSLSVVAFPGAAAATWLGVSALWGYFGFCVVAAAVIGIGSRQVRSGGSSGESALIGVVQAFALACGYLFVVLYHGFLGETQSLLFGTFLGVTDRQVLVLAVAALAVLAAITVLGRRMVFSSVDPALAGAKGISARWTGTVFLIMLGLAVAEVSQITGALLVFALLVMPPAAAQQITSRPGLGVGLSVVLGLVVAWLGLGVSYFSAYPTGFWITTVGIVVYVSSTVFRAVADRRSPGTPPDPSLSRHPRRDRGPALAPLPTPNPT